MTGADAAALVSPFADFVAFEVVTAAQLGDFQLFPEEEEALSLRAVEARRLDFRLGRAVARRATERLLGAQLPIPKAEDGRPLWPAGVVGAISHSAKVAVAAVAATTDCVGIGVDIEQRNRLLKTDISEHVCRANEIAWLDAAATPTDRNERLLRLFAAKESIFKALYPVELVYLGFHDAELCWDDATGAFDAELLKAAGAAYPIGYRLTVGCCIAGSFILASTTVY